MPDIRVHPQRTEREQRPQREQWTDSPPRFDAIGQPPTQHIPEADAAQDDPDHTGPDRQRRTHVTSDQPTQDKLQDHDAEAAGERQSVRQQPGGKTKHGMNTPRSAVRVRHRPKLFVGKRHNENPVHLIRPEYHPTTGHSERQSPSASRDAPPAPIDSWHSIMTKIVGPGSPEPGRLPVEYGIIRRRIVVQRILMLDITVVSMILCVTLNPCLDKTLTVPHWRPGDLVRGVAVRDVVGGKGNNVSRRSSGWDERPGPSHSWADPLGIIAKPCSGPTMGLSLWSFPPARSA